MAGELWRRLAVIYGDRMSRFDLAARAWNEVLGRNPKDMFVLEPVFPSWAFAPWEGGKRAAPGFRYASDNNGEWLSGARMKEMSGE